jgi:PAS domain-containing protein
MAEKKVIEIDVNTKDAVKAMDNLSKATHDVSKSFEEVYGDLQPLTTRMGEAEDRLYELANAGKTTTQEYKDLLKTVGDYRKVQINTDLAVDAAATTMGQKLGGALGGVTSSFSIAQGVMGAFGSESEELEKALLKVQSALAIQQGLQGIKEAIPSFRALGTAAKDALTGIRTGIAATGIGLFVIALGTVVAYWDEIKEAINGVSEEQDELNKKTALNTESEKDKLETLNSQDNILKLQGKSEEEILKLKIAQNERVIKTTEAEIKQKEITSKLEIKAAERNASIMKTALKASLEFSAFGLRLLAAPIDLVLTTANKISEALGFGKITAINLNDEISNIINYGAEKLTSFVFDPEETKKKAEADIKATKDALLVMKNEVAGFKLQVIDLNKPSEVAKKETEKAFESYEELELKKASLLKHSELTLQGHIDIEAKMRRDAAAYELQELKVKALRASQIDEKAQSEKVKLTKAGFDTIAQITELFGKRSEKAAKAAFKIQKAANIASALITTYQSATAAYASQFTPLPDPSSPVRGAIAAGIAVASGLANVAKIGQQKFEGGGSTGGGGGASVPNGGAIPQAPTFNVVGNSGINQLAQLQQQPTKAYVVSGDMTTAQALDRNRIENATLVQ